MIIKINMLNEMKSSKFIGLLADESSDCTGNEILSLYIRYFSEKSSKVIERFFVAIELEKANAENIHNVIKTHLTEHDLYDKLAFFCSDGAPVMCPTNNGVAGRLISDLPKTSKL